MSSIILAQGCNHFNNMLLAPSKRNLVACATLDANLIDNHNTFITANGASRLALYDGLCDPSQKGTARLVVNLRQHLLETYDSERIKDEAASAPHLTGDLHHRLLRRCWDVDREPLSGSFARVDRWHQSDDIENKLPFLQQSTSRSFRAGKNDNLVSTPNQALLQWLLVILLVPSSFTTPGTTSWPTQTPAKFLSATPSHTRSSSTNFLFMVSLAHSMPGYQTSSHRDPRVVIEGACFESTTVDSGVPQRTVLGPILFLCHINDLPSSVSSQVRLFADDCLLYSTTNTVKDHLTLQQHLKQLEVGADTWGMRFNASKCYTLSIKEKSNFHYTLNSTILKHVTNNSYLGILFSQDLKWGDHIAKICKKANSTVGFLRRNLWNCPSGCKRNAYLSLVRSVLGYGATLWDPYLQKDINKLEQVQRKAARFVSGDYKSRTPGSMQKLLRKLDLLPLQVRRQQLRRPSCLRWLRGWYRLCLQNTSLLLVNQAERLDQKETVHSRPAT